MSHRHHLLTISIITLLLGSALFVSCSRESREATLFPDNVLRLAQQDLGRKIDDLSLDQSALEVSDTDSLTKDESAALTFLYAYMDLPDLMDHTPEYYLANVRTALQAREELPWGKKVPAKLFRHFVLPLRVNNEFLDDFRTTYYTELRDLVQGMTMEEAVLELNHWSHRHITYAPSDGRTLPPMSTLRNALGRCGEQSTFVTAVLRTVGIPARQVYTPRWAHTDNNHAWVEAWVDGEWHYLGASEPAPVLDNAWFDAPVLRAMLLHTTAFGHYSGDEEWLGETPVSTELNVSDNYVPTATAKARVLRPDGTPAEGAEVTFRLYNYAELYPLVRRTANKLGEASVKLGLGDIVIVANEGPLIAMQKLTVRPDAEPVELTLGSWEDLPDEQSFLLTPPAEKRPSTRFTPEQEEQNNLRLAQNDSIRHAYTATFPTREGGYELAKSLGLSGKKADQVAEYAVLSRGNHEVITSFLKKAHSNGRIDDAISLLGSLRPKDLGDISAAVLADSFHRDLTPEQWQSPDIICPRVMLEPLFPSERELKLWVDDIASTTPDFYSGTLSDRAEAIGEYIRTFWVDDRYNPRRMPMSPAATWKLRGGDERSLTILLVRLLRTAEVPARYDTANGVVLYTDESGADHLLRIVAPQDPETGIGDDTRTCPLQLTYKEPQSFLKKPLYEVHYTVNYLKEEDSHLTTYGFDYEAEPADINGTNLLYTRNLLSTGIRQADGTARYLLRKLPCGVPTELHFDINDDLVNVIGELDAENLYFDHRAQAEKSILSTTGRGYYLLVLARPHHEPSDHILRDLQSLLDDTGALPIPVVALTPDKGQQQSLQDLLPQATWGTDTQGILGSIAAGMEQEQPLEFPVVVVADTFNRIVFFSQGYTIGIGDRIAAVLESIRMED